MSDNEYIDNFLKWFESEYPLAKGTNTKVFIFNNSYNKYIEEANQISQALFKNIEMEPQKSYGAAFLGYGFSTGAIISHGKPLTITQQVHYEDIPVWKMNVSPLLNIDAGNIYDNIDDISDMNKEQTEIGEFLKWLINPEGNWEIFEDVFQKICSKMVNELYYKLPGRNKKEIKLIVPLLSDLIEEIDWELILSNLDLENVNVTIEGPASICEVREDERVYIFYKHEWDFDTCYIMQAIELSQRGEPVSIASYGWIETIVDEDSNIELFPLKNIGKSLVQLSGTNHSEKYQNRSNSNSLQIKFDVKSKLEQNPGFRSYLGNHYSGFYDAYFLRNRDGIAKNQLQQKICSVVCTDKSSALGIICAKICNETNLVNISLSDMVSVGLVLENKSLFKPTTVSMKRKIKHNTSKSILPQISYKLESFPANFDDFSWKNLNSYKTKDKYMEMSNEILRQLPLDSLLQLIINHFRIIKTADIAEELFAVHGLNQEPTALFVARLFGYLSQNEKFVIESMSHEVELD